MEPVYCCAKLLTVVARFPQRGAEEASLHCIHLTFFAPFRSVSALFGLFGLCRFLGNKTQLNTHTTCMCMQVHANQLQVHVGISAVVTGQRALGIGQKSRPQLCKSALQCGFFRCMTSITCNFLGIPVK